MESAGGAWKLTRCLVCDRPLRTRTGRRFCANHIPGPGDDMPVPSSVPFDAYEPVRFQAPPPAELLMEAVDSLLVLGPDGRVDEERTKEARGRWLSRTLAGAWEKRFEHE